MLYFIVTKTPRIKVKKTKGQFCGGRANQKPFFHHEPEAQINQTEGEPRPSTAETSEPKQKSSAKKIGSNLCKYDEYRSYEGCSDIIHLRGLGDLLEPIAVYRKCGGSLVFPLVLG